MNRPPQRAITFTAQQRAELLETPPDPRPLGDDEVAGRTVATLVSPGTEIGGVYLGDRFPSRPGTAAVFEVEEAGAHVRDIRIGDRVFTAAGHRSWQRRRREDVLPLPQGLAPDTAVFARLMGVSMTTLATTDVRPPAPVLVTGLGIVGNLAAQLFAACGYEVFAAEPSAARRELAHAKGIARTFVRTPTDDPALVDRIGLVLECSGHEQAALDGCKVAAKGGEVVLIGVPWRAQAPHLQAHALAHAVFFRYVRLRSGWEWELPTQPAEFARGNIADNFAAALRWLAAGRVRVDGLYDTAQPEAAQRVYQDLLHQRSAHLATVFDWATP